MQLGSSGLQRDARIADSHRERHGACEAETQSPARLVRGKGERRSGRARGAEDLLYGRQKAERERVKKTRVSLEDGARDGQQVCGGAGHKEGIEGCEQTVTAAAARRSLSLSSLCRSTLPGHVELEGGARLFSSRIRSP